MFSLLLYYFNTTFFSSSMQHASSCSHPGHHLLGLLSFVLASPTNFLISLKWHRIQQQGSLSAPGPSIISHLSSFGFTSFALFFVLLHTTQVSALYFHGPPPLPFISQISFILKPICILYTNYYYTTSISYTLLHRLNHSSKLHVNYNIQSCFPLCLLLVQCLKVTSGCFEKCRQIHFFFFLFLLIIRKEKLFFTLWLTEARLTDYEYLEAAIKN